MSLLSEAKKVKMGHGPLKSTYTREHEELAVAYLKGEITLKQAASVLNLDASGSATSKIASIITQGVRNGTVTIALV